MDGFFPAKMSLPTVAESTAPQCGRCGLFKTCNSPKMPPTGKGRKRILIVAEAPGKEEDKQGKQLVGNSGEELMKVLRKLDIDMRRDCTLTNSLICRPPNNEIKNEAAIDYCRPNLVKTLEEVKPKVVILLGKRAVQSLIPHVWKNTKHTDTIEPWVGWKIPAGKIRAWVCPTWHPSYLLRMKDDLLERMFSRHLEEAVKLADEPRPPKYEEPSVQPVYHDKLAAKLIRIMANGSRPVAYDYETNRLKPDGKGARIRCVGLSDGKMTFACEIGPRVTSAMKEFLQSDVPKIGYNLKMESRWSKAIFDVWPKNEYHDGMIASHVLDGRKGITSLKFQSFVRFGTPDYNSHVEPYLVTKDGHEDNRVFDLPAKDVLTYCGMDAFLEWQVCQSQRKELGL